MEENKTFNIFKYVSLGLYILCMVVLIVESCITSEHSVNQSTSLGTLIADFFNNIAGDQATDIKIESVKIDNKIETVNVGDKLTLKTTILPENTSDKSLNYTSSNEDVAIISNVGEITFLKEGTTTITAFSEKYTDIKDSFIVNVKKVKLTNISSRILDVTPDDQGVYTLFINSSYTISTAYTPSNTTDKNVKYSLDSEDYLNIKGDVITPKAFSGEDITLLTSSQDDIKHTLKIKTAFKETIHPESVNIENTYLYVNQTIFPKVIINPTNATTSNYILSSNSDIVKIENNFITGVKSGKATIKVSLLDYPSIYFEKEIEVLSSPSMESFNVSVLNEVMINKDYNIDILPYPYYSKKEDISNFEITSLDESIIKIANNKIRPLKEGKTSVLVKYNNISISKEINVYSKLEEEKEFTVTLIKNNILSNKEYQLSEVIKSNENLLYFLKDDKNGIIDNVNNKLKITNTGKIDIICLHKPSGNIKEVSLFSASSFNIKNDKI